MNKKDVEKLVGLRLDGLTWDEVSKSFPGMTPNALRKAFYRHTRDSKAVKQEITQAKVLLLDVETAPLEVWAWGLFDQNIGLNQIMKHSSLLSWSAKWLGSDQVMYEDNSKEKDVRNDKKLLKSIWKLIDEADILIFQNGISFDRKVLNARFIQNGMKPPSSCRYIDTMRIAKKHFKFTSNKLEHLTGILCTEHRKSTHGKFSGFNLWKECLAGNTEAWAEMKEYNILDVLSMEELYYKLRPWDKGINFNTYHSELHFKCSCGSEEFKKHGFVHTNNGKFQRYICKSCGNESVDKSNLLIKEKRQTLRK